MTPLEIKDLLPDPDKANYEEIKASYPYNILQKYASAIDEKYPQKLSGIIVESTDISNDKLLSYAFYILASIGNGYSYRLLELSPTTTEMYPLKVTVFDKIPQELSDNISTPKKLEEVLQKILKGAFVHTLILNLLAQVDLYNESRNED